MTVSERERLEGLTAAARAEADALQVLLNERRAELIAAQAAAAGPELATVDVDEATRLTARELALRRVVAAVEQKCEAARAKVKGCEDAETLNAIQVTRVREFASTKRAELVRYRRRVRELTAELDTLQRAIGDAERTCEDADSEIRRLWADAPLPRLPSVVQL